MAEAYIDLLMAFGFKEMQIWIATISALLFSGNLLGGILTALMFVNSNALIQRPLKERISFRLFILSEVLLVIFVFFYHVFMIERMTLSHVIYWISAMMTMPLLAVIGSQAILVTFSSRVKAKEQTYKKQMQAQRAQRGKGREASGGSSGGHANPAEKAMARRQGAKHPPKKR